MTDIISPADLARHLFKTDGHLAPNPYPLNTSERAEFSQAICDLYIADSREAVSALDEMFGDALNQLKALKGRASCL